MQFRPVNQVLLSSFPTRTRGLRKPDGLKPGNKGEQGFRSSMPACGAWENTGYINFQNALHAGELSVPSPGCRLA